MEKCGGSGSGVTVGILSGVVMYHWSVRPVKFSASTLMATCVLPVAAPMDRLLSVELSPELQADSNSPVHAAMTRESVLRAAIV